MNKTPPIEFMIRKVIKFFIKKETMITIDAKYPRHSVKEIATIIIFFDELQM